MTGLTRKGETDGTWYPVSVSRLEAFLENAIFSGQGYSHPYALKKNLAYNLQYLEFQDRILNELKLSSVIEKQTIKTFVLVGCGVIESILHYLLIVNNVHSTTEWEEKAQIKGNQKRIDGDELRFDVVIYEKLDSPELKYMTYDAMIKCAESNKLFGTKSKIYEMLKSLKKLRNRVHLQSIEHHTDTDWNAISPEHLNDMRGTLYAIFTSSIFSPSAEQRKYFSYLKV